MPRVEARALLPRALLIWCGLLVAAFVNGALREILLAPALGERLAAPISALVFAAIIVLAAWWLVRSATPQSARVWLAIGVLWAGMTVAFEFVFFGWLMGVPWPELLATLDPRRGGWFGLVLLVALLAPSACGALQDRDRR
jgi:hypothetical protein